MDDWYGSADQALDDIKKDCGLSSSREGYR